MDTAGPVHVSKIVVAVEILDVGSNICRRGTHVHHLAARPANTVSGSVGEQVEECLTRNVLISHVRDHEPVICRVVGDRWATHLIISSTSAGTSRCRGNQCDVGSSSSIRSIEHINLVCITDARKEGVDMKISNIDPTVVWVIRRIECVSACRRGGGSDRECYLVTPARHVTRADHVDVEGTTVDPHPAHDELANRGIICQSRILC